MNKLDAIRANARKNWYEIRNAADDGPVQVLIYGEIGDSFWSESVPASQFVRDLAEVDDAKAVDFHIHSPGGSVFDGLAIATAIRTHPAPTVAYVDGLAASAASYIAIAADQVVMAVGSQMMIHEASGIALGNAADMTKMADDLNRVSGNIASLYALKAGGTVEDWRAAMLAETWYSAEEAVTAGLADRVDKKHQADTKNTFDLSIFAHAGRDNAPAPRLLNRHTPPAPPVDSPQKEGDDMAMSDQLASGLREKLGLAADAELDDATVLAALDEALAERVEPKNVVPPGTVLVDASIWDELKEKAAQGAQARAQQVAEARARIVDNAIAEGKVTPARRDHWLAALTADHEGAEATLAGLAPGLVVPIVAQGYTGGLSESSDDDRIYEAAFGKAEV